MPPKMNSMHDDEYVAHGYFIRRATCEVIRFSGSRGEFVAAEYGPDKYFTTPEEAIQALMDEGREAEAAERRRPWM